MVPLVPEKILVGEAVSVALPHVVDNAGVVTVTGGTVWLKSKGNP
jgi:hypothetical protein